MSAGSPQGRMVLVVDPDLGFADALAALLVGDRVVAARSMAEGVMIAEGGRLDLAILGPTFGSEEGVASAAALRDADPALLTVLVADVPTNRLLRMAIRSGLTDVIDAPLTARKLVEVLGRTDAIDDARSIPVVFETSEDAAPQHQHVVFDAPHVPLIDPLPVPEPTASPNPSEEAATVSHGSSSDSSFEDAFAGAFDQPIEMTDQPTAPVPAPAFEEAPALFAPELPPVPEFPGPPPEEPRAIEHSVSEPPPIAGSPASPDLAPELALELGPEPALELGPEPAPEPAPELGPEPAPEMGPEPAPEMGPEPAPELAADDAFVAPAAPAAPPVPDADQVFAPPILPLEDLVPEVASDPSALSPEEHFSQLAPTRPGSEPAEAHPFPSPLDLPSMPSSSQPPVGDTLATAPIAMDPVPAPPALPVAGSPADLAGLGSETPLDPSPVPLARRRPDGGRVITVMAGKGGSGKTITATNLAAALTERLGEDQVVIVDADLQFGDVALMMQVDPIRTIVEAVAELEDLTEHRLDALLLRHDSGLRVLPAPLVPASADKVNAKDVVRIVEMLRGMYRYVIVDTAPIFDDGLITMLEHSDDVLVVVDMDLPSVKNAKIALDTLRAIGFDVGRIKLVVNRANSKARLDLAELERALGEEVSASIPSDRLIPQSVNEGVPAVAFSPRSRVAKAFHALADLFLPS